MKKVEIYFTEAELHEIPELQKKRHLVDLEKIFLKAVEERDQRKSIFNNEARKNEEQQTALQKDIKKYEDSNNSQEVVSETKTSEDGETRTRENQHETILPGEHPGFITADNYNLLKGGNNGRDGRN